MFFARYGKGRVQHLGHTHQQRVQLGSMVGEKPGGLLAQLANLGDLMGRTEVTACLGTWH